MKALLKANTPRWRFVDFLAKLALLAIPHLKHNKWWDVWWTINKSFS